MSEPNPFDYLDRRNLTPDEEDMLHQVRQGGAVFSRSQEAALYAAVHAAYVLEGQDWSRVAKRYGVSFDELCELTNEARAYFGEQLPQ